MKPTCRELLDQVCDTETDTATVLAMLASRVERVLALHRKDRVWCRVCGCDVDPMPWPCPTVRLLDGEEP